MTSRRLRGASHASSSISATVVGVPPLGLLGSTAPARQRPDLASEITSLLLRAPDLVGRCGLTPREAEVALEVASGGRNRDVAGRLGLSVHTVRRHVESILAKLRITSRSSILPLLLAKGSRSPAEESGALLPG